MIARIGHSELDIAVVVQTHLHATTRPQADSVTVPASFISLIEIRWPKKVTILSRVRHAACIASLVSVRLIHLF